MQSIITRTFLALLFVLPTAAVAEEYVIDETHAFVQFKASHIGYSYVIGRFNGFSGTFSYDPNDPAVGATTVTIDTPSVDSNHAERDKHLRDKDFLNVEKYPTITFVSTEFRDLADDKIEVVGDLTVRGKTETVTLSGRHVGAGDDPWGGYRRGFEASVEVNSRDFGFPRWVGDVELYVVVEGVRS